METIPAELIFLPTIQKWNFKTHKYEKFKFTKAKKRWVVVLFSEDMDLEINCVNCGKKMTYGQGYTSRQYHNHAGLGYPVCEDCYNKEWELEEKYRS